MPNAVLVEMALIPVDSDLYRAPSVFSLYYIAKPSDIVYGMAIFDQYYGRASDVFLDRLELFDPS